MHRDANCWVRVLWDLIPHFIFDLVMTIHRLHAGDGYLYLTQQVACGDRVRDRTRDLTRYYTETGTPPGIWMGHGATELGLSGEVTEAQMQALFGEGLHPNADTIIATEIAAGKTAKQAIQAAELGAAFSEFTTKPSPISGIYDRMVDEFTTAERRRPTWDERTALRSDAARAHLTTTLGRAPTRAEIESALVKEKAASRRAVAGFDCVFTPPKSISLLWALGDDQLRAVIWKCHREAVREALAWAESQCALTRRGHNGTRQIDANGLVIAAFEHFDNRCGDPNLHTHAVISTKVRGSDGKWTALDARPLFASAVSFSCRYNATIVGKIRRRTAFRFEERHRGRGKQPVLEVAGIGDDMITEFSRTPDIIARTEQLFADYRATHGHNPSAVTQYKLAQQATLQTRNTKPVPKTLRDMITEWADRARAFLDDGRTGIEFLNSLLTDHSPPERKPFDATEVAVAIGVDLGGVTGLAATDHRTLDTRIREHLTTCQFDSPTQRDRAHASVRTLLSRDPTADLLDHIDAAHTARQRSIYEPQQISDEVLETVARRRATWTEANIRSAVEDRVGVCTFASDDEQRAAVETITTSVRDRLSLRLSIDPDPVPPGWSRRNGDSVFTVQGATRYTSQAVLDAETRLLDAATTPTAELVPARRVDRAIARIQRRGGPQFDTGQRDVARYLCTCGTLLAVAVGPAGAGKTTAMRAVADAWRADGRDIVALAPSASAARHLEATLGVPAKTIAKLLTQADYGAPTGVSPGAMILIDEASMAATADLDAVLSLARQHGAVVRCVGDPEQLSAVEAGGILRTLARDTRAPTLHRLVRFSDPAEADATLHLRDGNAEAAWAFYDSHDRVSHGMSDQLRTEILAAYLDDTTRQVPSLMIAGTLANVAALNAATQAAHAAAGRIDTTGARIRLSDTHTGYRGDTILTRRNSPAIRVLGGIRDGTGIDNGDLWHIHHIHTDGSLTATGIGHRGTVHLPPDYVRAHVELGYATTIHRAEGTTVDHAHVLMDNTLGRALAYVGLTRGRHLNRIYLATDTLLDPTGDQQPDDPTTPKKMFARVLAREDDNISATDVMRDEQTTADRRARVTYAEVYRQLADARATYLLDRALPTILFRETAGSKTFQELVDTIALADAHGLDTGELVGAIATHDHHDLGQSLTTARDTAALLRARADRWIRNRLPIAASPITLAAAATLTTLTVNDATAITAALNTTPVLAIEPGAFRTLRDAPYPGCYPPVPPPHHRSNAALTAFAEQLRQRLLTPNVDVLLPPNDTVAAPQTPTRIPDFDPGSAVDQFGPAERRARIDRLIADYHHYIRELAHDYIDDLLYRALPVVVHRQAQQSRHYDQLLDTIALADAHRLDIQSLIAAIATNDHRDLATSLLLARDPSVELRTRADFWIHDHSHGTAPPAVIHFNQLETLTDTHKPDPLRKATAEINSASHTLQHPPRPHFRALDHLPYTCRLRPIPQHTEHTDHRAEFATALRHRINDEQDQLAASTPNQHGKHDTSRTDESPSPATTPTPPPRNRRPPSLRPRRRHRTF
ncbi:relaxase domain-containing protein [Nocardia terpenica]|uniref:MobF family relaxase n=1 Tax=Nocardia terpenica TaxID=455432 RepID=UPI00189475E8|nr:MobF family relaxase [Nocardia terpenica]MBF6110456.1 relaxase domain-containing protein [Nocardia terpenica]MBF6151792.1 relaxase domain-containing protein [Nocardia terpenica]